MDQSKSGFSGSGECAGAGSWRKASRSTHNGACVEVGQDGAVVGVRDTRLGDASPVLAFSSGAWERFTAAVRGA